MRLSARAARPLTGHSVGPEAQPADPDHERPRTRGGASFPEPTARRAKTQPVWAYGRGQAGASRRREQNAEIAVEQSEEDISDRERAIKLEVKQAYLNLERARKSLDIAIEQVRNATESLNATQGRYEQNMVIFLEILNAQARYAQALNNQVGAFYDLKIAQTALEKAMGTLKFED